MAWYFGIATEGYRVLSHNPRDQQNFVFFPAFPMLTRVTARLLGGSSMAFVIAGTVVAFAAFFWGLTYLFRIARDMLGDDDPARYAVWLIATYPFALFLRRQLHRVVVPARRDGCAVSLPSPRTVGCRCMGAARRPDAPQRRIPVDSAGDCRRGAVAAGMAERRSGVQHRARPGAPLVPALVPAMLAAAMPGIGVLIYSAFIWRLTGNPLAWQAGHAAWGRDYTGFSSLISDRYAWLANEGLYAYTSQVPGDLLNALGAIFVLAATFPWRGAWAWPTPCSSW